MVKLEEADINFSGADIRSCDRYEKKKGEKT